MSPAIGPSLLDRLYGQEGYVVKRVRDGLKRDLEDLLNTPQRVIGWGDELGELDASLLNYGIVDLSTSNLSTEQMRAAVVEQIGETIRRLEPRLADMKISAIPNADPADRSLRMRIEVHIMVESEAEPVFFNTIIDPISNLVSLTNAGA
ncbi:type VI secretion system baseplate subunit TssE [Aquabacter sp. CN5-332]|uniref:type VI secretion system baseplate subunit TssE n=1 Tax=Aquabacter sp. CN5-332 TaxID=3156608 RepID=UPI0032B5E2D4